MMMFKRTIGLIFGLMLAPVAAWSEDFALVISDSAVAGSERHDSAVAALEAAGYQVFQGLDLDRERLATLSVRLEQVLSGSDRLVIHLTGQFERAADLSVILPHQARAEAVGEILTQGVPLALFLDLASQRPGQSIVALGGPGAEAPLPEAVPQGVLLVRGPAADVDDVLSRQMLAENLPATEIDGTTAGIALEGLVTPMLRLGLEAPLPPQVALSAPEAVETALALDLAARAEIQRDLTELGHEPGDVDGVFGAGTRAALRAFQAEAGLTVTGFLTRDQWQILTETAEARRAATRLEEEERTAWDVAREIDTLYSYQAFLEVWGNGRFTDRAQDRINTLEAAAETAERVAGYRESEKALGLTVASVAILERRLTVQGFDAGAADGRIDRQTRRSIAAFQARNGLTSTGYFNTATVQRLILAGDG